MKTKSVPAIIMLAAGLIACLAGIRTHMELAVFLKMLIIVLIVFYLIGCLAKFLLDRNFMDMRDEETTDGEEDEREAEEKDMAEEEDNTSAGN